MTSGVLRYRLARAASKGTASSLGHLFFQFLSGHASGIDDFAFPRALKFERQSQAGFALRPNHKPRLRVRITPTCHPQDLRLGRFTAAMNDLCEILFS